MAVCPHTLQHSQIQTIATQTIDSQQRSAMVSAQVQPQANNQGLTVTYFHRNRNRDKGCKKCQNVMYSQNQIVTSKCIQQIDNS